MNRVLLKNAIFSFSLLLGLQAFSSPIFAPAIPLFTANYEINGEALCATAKQTLSYLNKGAVYDPQVIHSGKILPIPLIQIKATLRFICQYQSKLNDPVFVKKHFEFIRWQPDMAQVRHYAAHKPLLAHLPSDHILMTKYYIHVGAASNYSKPSRPFALYALPLDEEGLKLEQANTNFKLTRFRYGKQAILAGALAGKKVPVLAYVNRSDLESALMQGTIIADFDENSEKKIFNVHRNNNIGYDRVKSPYAQERYWYFKQVDGIKGYGKDSDHKITINPEVTFAADLVQLGLGKLLMIQYPDPAKSGHIITRAGILADTGGAFTDNLYQVDYLLGTYRGKEAYMKAARHLPDYVNAYFMVVKNY